MTAVLSQVTVVLSYMTAVPGATDRGPELHDRGPELHGVRRLADRNRRSPTAFPGSTRPRSRCLAMTAFPSYLANRVRCLQTVFDVYTDPRPMSTRPWSESTPTVVPMSTPTAFGVSAK